MDGLEAVHKASASFPSHELFGLTSQIRRAAYSVALNISEGYKRRRYPRDFLRQLITAHGSAAEVECAIEIAVRLKYIATNDGRTIWKQYDELGRMLEGLIKSVESDVEKAR
ncbi:MAG: four helix bundle protein [Planctomycetota bacterium]|nr:MAG: four helix bundle protein [Planctomycetota bacterium]